MKFEELNINKPLINALNDLGFSETTSIQENIFSVVMSGRDVCGIAQTGTGKTLAYLLPLIRMWSFSKEKMPQILVIVPTRELVVQVLEVAALLTKYLSFDSIGIYGGVNINNQVKELTQGCDMVVATPGRFIDLVASGTLKVKNIKKLVIDEFDMMLDLGFRPQLQDIFEKIPEKRQNLLFSATISDEADELLNDIFKSPIFVEGLNSGSPLKNIEQKAYNLPNFNTKLNFLELLLANDVEMTKTLVFVSSKAIADLLFEKLTELEVKDLDVVHSNKSQNYRFSAIEAFQNGETKILIATDIASRGLDVQKISHVLNFDLPNEPEDYIHRIGRTGRATAKGTAISFFTEKDAEKRKNIEQLMNMAIPQFDIPAYLEISSELMSFEHEEVYMKTIKAKASDAKGPSFHEKLEKNKKVNVRRNIEKEKQKKYGKSYRKEN
jgi:ATP-dependent RNA helicase RhlE